MEKSLKKSIYLGTAALALVATLGLGSAKADAATAKITSNTFMTTSGNSRNVNVSATGSNAIYTKAGILKGAKVVASKTQVAALRNSKAGSANLRAYAVATTNRGTVYYKVVSFDKQYRGWIYGGTTKNVFGGGLTAYNTTKDATVPSTTDTYKLGSTSTTANTTVFAAPAWTQYKLGRAKDQSGKVITSTEAYKDATFKLGKAVTTSREGDTWYQITGSSNADLNGAWVKSSDVTNTNGDNSAIADNQTRVNFVDATSQKSLGKYTITRLNGEISPQQTLTRASGKDMADDSTAQSAGLNSTYWNDKVPALSGYNFANLTVAQKAANTAAIKSSAYGKEITILVANQGNVQAFTAQNLSFNVYREGQLQTPPTSSSPTNLLMNSGTQAMIELGHNAVKIDWKNAQNTFAGSLLAPKGKVFTKDEFKTALTNAGLDDFYVVQLLDASGQPTNGFKTDSSALVASGSGGDLSRQFRITHVTYQDVAGNLTAGSTNDVTNISYSSQSKDITVYANQAADKWASLFANN